MVTEDDPPTFTLFPGLPPELRIKIWYHSLPGPRIIEAACDPQGPSSFSFNGAHPPSVLRACRESRDTALSVYKPLFESDIRRNYLLGNRSKTLPLIYINPAHDTIYVSTPYDSDRRRLIYPEFAQRYPDVTSAQSIAVDFSNSRDISTILTSIIRSHPNGLKEIVLVPVLGSSNRIYGVKEPEILFERDSDPLYGYGRAEDEARDVGAALCPGICVRVMAVKTTRASAHPRQEGDYYGSDHYYSDDYDSDD